MNSDAHDQEVALLEGCCSLCKSSYAMRADIDREGEWFAMNAHIRVWVGVDACRGSRRGAVVYPRPPEIRECQLVHGQTHIPFPFTIALGGGKTEAMGLRVQPWQIATKEKTAPYRCTGRRTFFSQDLSSEFFFWGFGAIASDEKGEVRKSESCTYAKHSLVHSPQCGTKKKSRRTNSKIPHRSINLLSN
jgi:hypothetical protein